MATSVNRVCVEVIVIKRGHEKRVKTYREYVNGTVTGRTKADIRKNAEQWALSRIKEMYAAYHPAGAIFRIYH